MMGQVCDDRGPEDRAPEVCRLVLAKSQVLEK